MFNFTLQEIVNLTQLLGLIVITGGTITLGALAAPSLFKNLNREEAGSVMVEIFGKFSNWIKVSAILILLAKLIDVVCIHKFNFFVQCTVGEELVKSLNTNMLVSTLLVVAIAATSLHIAFKLSPAIVESYEADSEQFPLLHKQSEMLHRVNFLLGIGLLFSFVV
jgi:uncharacterized membrane protein